VSIHDIDGFSNALIHLLGIVWKKYTLNSSTRKDSHMALGSKEANRIFFVTMAILAALPLFVVGVIGYKSYQAWHLHQEVISGILPTASAMSDMEMATDPAQKQVLAKKVLAFWEKALADKHDPGGRCDLIEKAGMVAVDAGDLAEAKDYAHLLLDDPTILQQSCSNRRAPLHVGNMILGRIALRQGDLEQAKEFLLKAGKSPIEEGATPTTLFEPKMILAKELLEKGERESVLQYFDLCSKFWQDGGVLKRWRSTVEAGGIPDFGVRGNLY
jgi:hypothetical protein